MSNVKSLITQLADALDAVMEKLVSMRVVEDDSESDRKRKYYELTLLHRDKEIYTSKLKGALEAVETAKLDIGISDKDLQRLTYNTSLVEPFYIIKGGELVPKDTEKYDAIVSKIIEKP